MRKGTFLLILMLLQLSIFVLGKIPQIEREALIALYNSTDGDNWLYKGGWKIPPLAPDGFAMPGTEGNWFGVTVSGDHVVQIDLELNNLKGSIPSQLGNLSNLQWLDFSGYNFRKNGRGNFLSGSIPKELGNLAQLTYMRMDDNQLSGDIPAELGKLSNLQSLSLGSNQLTSIPVGLGSLSNLKFLYLDNNQLSSIPPDLSKLSNLQELSLGNNHLTRIPPEFGNLSKLRWLWLYNNQLTSIPTDLGKLSNLQEFYLDNNQLTAIPSELGNLNILKILQIDHNYLITIPSNIVNLRNLSYLDIDYNCLSITDPALRNWLNTNDSDWEMHQYQCDCPVLTTNSVTSITSTSATCGGNITSNGGVGITARGVCWSTSAYPTTTNSKTTDGTATGSFSSSLTGLTPGTTYHVRAYAINVFGTSYGNDVIFTTNGSTFTISGRVTVGGTGLSGVTMNGLPANPVTDSNGNYTGTVNANWSGTVTPSKTGYTFTPSSKGYTNVLANKTGENYTAVLTSNPTGWNPPDGLQNNMIVEGKAYNKNIEAAAGDWIGAFGPGGVSDCRAVGTISANGYYYLTIRSNASSGEIITFKLFPLPSGPAIDSCESIEFISDSTYSDLALHFGTRTQTFSLVKGWNWISFNIRPSNTTLNSVFASTQNSIEQVKSQNKAAIYSNGNWVGDLTDLNGIENGIMYKVKTSQACNFSVSGLPIPYNKPIALVTDWNWVAYLPPTSLPIKKAIDSIVACLIQAKSQTQSVLKKSTGLVGDLTQMDPNKGYTIKALNACTFIYPYTPWAFPDKTSVMVSPMRESPSNPVPWAVIKGNQFNMICSGNVYVEGKPIQPSGYYLVSEGPGGKNDCRSISKIEKDGSYFATILGNTKGETIHFKLYNSTNGKTYDIEGSIRFQADELKTGYDLRVKPVTSSTSIPDNN
ncbi:MAG: leucine-rich repeat domain-containing protein [Candidatus Omnitrophota bacterium]